MNLDFSGIKNKKTIVGGIDGKIAVKLVGFAVKKNSKGEPNYQFKLEAVDYTDYIIPYNCGESFYRSTISHLGLQLGFEKGVQHPDEEILTKASEEVFYIWKNDGYINFYEKTTDTVETEEAPDLK